MRIQLRMKISTRVLVVGMTIMTMMSMPTMIRLMISTMSIGMSSVHMLRMFVIGMAMLRMRIA